MAILFVGFVIWIGWLACKGEMQQKEERRDREMDRYADACRISELERRLAGSK